jgi:cytochrome c556
MHRKIVICGLVGPVILATATLLYAHFTDGVLKTDMSDPAQVVDVRKAFMQAIRSNMIDLNKKLKTGRIEDMAVNGGNIAALATVLPVLYEKVYKDVYPVEGSNTYFKGAKPAAFEAASDRLRSAGADIGMAAEKKNKAGVEAGLESLKASCGGCHSAFRGKY